MTTATTPLLSPAARVVVEAIAALTAETAGQVLHPQVALADAAALLRAREQLDVLLLHRLADVQARQLHREDDAPTLASWVRRQDAVVDPAQVTLARRLSRTPHLSDAVLAGAVCTTDAEKVARALDALRPHVDRPDGLIDGQDAADALYGVVLHGVADLVCTARGGLDDGLDTLTDGGSDAGQVAALQALLERLHALAVDPLLTDLARLEQAFTLLARELAACGARAQLPAALSTLTDALLPQRLEERERRAHDARGLVVKRNADGSGFTVTRGDLDLETGELLLTALDACAATDPDRLVDTAARAAVRLGDADPEGPLGPRSRAQRTHDALRLGLRALLDSGALGTRQGGVRPHLDVRVPLLALHRDRTAPPRVGALLAEDGAASAAGALPAVTGHGTRVPVRLLRRWLPDSVLTRTVLGLGSKPVEASHTQRTLTAHERRLLHAQWGDRCSTRHCTAPPGTALVPHHGEAWHRTGSTSIRDTALLCERCHDDLHVGHHVLALRDGRRLGEAGWVE